MKFTTKRENILTALTHLNRVIETKTTIRVLLHVRITQLKDSIILLETTNFKQSLSVNVEANILNNEKLDFCTNCQKLLDVVRSFPTDTELQFEINKNDFLVITDTEKSIKTKFELLTLPADDFPLISKDDPQISYSLVQQDLKEALKLTVTTISFEDERMFLNGIYFDMIDTNTINLVSTDGRCLTLQKIDIIGNPANLISLILPAKGLKLLTDLLVESEDELMVSISEESIIKFRAGAWVLTTNVMEGKFPNYVQVIPTGDFEIDAEFDTDICIEALKRISVMSEKEFQTLNMSLSLNGLKFHLDNLNAGVVDDELVDLFSSETKEFACRISLKYLINVLSMFKNEKAVIKVIDTSGTKPILFCKSGIPQSDFVSIIMPMRED
jgi:DNA polymerase-3 subunit beta